MIEVNRLLSAEELMPEYRELLAKGAELPLVISGNSMFPFLVPGRDTVYLKAVDRPLKRGDIVFYIRTEGQYILHRVCRVEADRLWFVGDAQDGIEGPLPSSCAFAYVTKLLRKDKMEYPGTFCWDFFAGSWLRIIRYRKKVLRIYFKLKDFSGSK